MSANKSLMFIIVNLFLA